MKLADFAFLTSPFGAHVLTDLAGEDLSDTALLSLLTRLRRTLTPEQAGPAVEQAALRRKAAVKFGDAAARMLFTRNALEQASDPSLRRYRADEARGFATIIDACCGIGSDALSFAGAGPRVLGLDSDRLRIEIARYNAHVLGLADARFGLHDVTAPLPERSDLIFFDPARRDEQGRRLHQTERYQPALSTLRSWDAQHIWAKLSPAVELAEIEGYGGMVEFHSVAGELKEALLRIDHAASEKLRTAAVRHDADGPERWEAGGPSPTVELREPGGWLLEPDPALLRAGFVAHFALALGAAQIDRSIAYLTVDSPPDTAWARAWRVLDWMPFGVKRLRAYLRERGVGHVTVKKRGHAMTPEQLVAALRLDGKGEELVVVLTRVDGTPAAVICEPR